MIIPLLKPYDFDYDSQFYDPQFFSGQFFSGPWSEKEHAAVILFYVPANETLTSFLLGLFRRYWAGHFVHISLLDFYQLFQHLRLPVWFGGFFSAFNVCVLRNGIALGVELM